MSLFTYVVRWDHGFAPNPFYGVCTLATCKPTIRKKAKLNDWVLGTGSAEKKNPEGQKYQGRAIFVMKASKIITFDEYWEDPQYRGKRPIMNGSLRQRFGDNIYHHDDKGKWVQADSRHSWNGQANDINLIRDTGTTDRVLIGNEFTYWGKEAPAIPGKFSSFIIKRPGESEITDQAAIEDFITWARSVGDQGRLADPLDWRGEKRWK